MVVRGEVAARVNVPMSPAEVHAIATDVSLVPHWNRDVRRARSLGNGRSVWNVHGPTGPLKWRVETTVNRRPGAWGLAMRGNDMAGYMRMDIARVGAGTSTVRLSRYLGIRRGPNANAIEAWWGDPQQRLQADLAHLVDVLRQAIDRPKPKVFDDHHLDALRFPDVTA